MTRISVCVPLYHHADTVRRCLDSVLDQDHDNFEILVVDDASDDEGAAIARSLLRPGDRLVVNETRLGAAGNHNHCVDLARGELIQFVHGDDELLPGALSTLAAAFDDDVAMAFAPRHIVGDVEDEARVALHSRFRQIDKLNDADDLISEIAYRGAWRNWIGEPTCVMFRRDCALRVGGFHGELAQIFDWDLWVHLSAGRRIAFVNRELSIRHHSERTLTAANLRERRDWLDHTRVLWRMAVNPEMPWRARVFASLWLSTCHPTSVVDAVRSPRGQRLSRLKSVIEMPVREMAYRRRVGSVGGR